MNDMTPEQRAMRGHPAVGKTIGEVLNQSLPVQRIGNVTYHHDLTQGSDEWLAARLGILTASEMGNLFTKSLQPSKGETPNTHLCQLLSQRITKFIELHFLSFDMARGHEDEVDACILYAKEIAPVQNCGFITNDKWGFTIGYSPDALVGMDGLIECKSRRPCFQIKTILESVLEDDAPPDEFMIQCQTGLMVSERQWLDFVSYSSGLPMAVIRVWPDHKLQSTILDVATEFEEKLRAGEKKYHAALASGARLFPTERKIYEEMSF